MMVCICQIEHHRGLQGFAYFTLDAELQPMDVVTRAAFKTLKRRVKLLMLLARLASHTSNPPISILSPLTLRRLETIVAGERVQDAGSLADQVPSIVNASPEERLQLLAAWDVNDRLDLAIELLEKQAVPVVEGSTSPPILPRGWPSSGFDIIRTPRRDPSAPKIEAPTSLPFPGTPLVLPPSGLWGSRRPGGGGGGGNDEINSIRQKIETAKLSPEARSMADRELKRLKRMSPINAEYQICLTYLETLTEVPWGVTTHDGLDDLDLRRAREQLDRDHYGLDKVKRRLLEYLAVLKLKQSRRADSRAPETKASAEQATDGTSTDEGRQGNAEDGHEPRGDNTTPEGTSRIVDRSPILLLVGPPGTGKTALSRSIAAALGRKFHRISLGGVRDEAEIRGHRRTYVAALPGLIVNGLRKVGVANPVFLLDEIDKVGMSNHHGDPGAAMLEVLDPEQNHSFKDHYLGIPIDLSKVLFIATANTTDTISAPLLDRMEAATLSGYTVLEKRQIASRHLIPKQIRANGLDDEAHARFGDAVIDRIIGSYTREAGVRNLERELGAVCRAKAVAYAEAMDAGRLEAHRAEVTMADVEDALGVERFEDEMAERSSRAGVVTGLVAYRSGGHGSILFVEAAHAPGRGRIQLTGKLGDVLKESVTVALTWVKAHAYRLGLTGSPTDDVTKDRDIHIHCPAGAIPKDGPSAGLAHTVALVSLFSGRPVPPTTAMTGEMSLRGRITAVGGIREKLIGASRAGVGLVLMPEHNRKDLKDLPEEVRQGVQVICVRSVDGHFFLGPRSTPLLPPPPPPPPPFPFRTPMSNRAALMRHLRS